MSYKLLLLLALFAATTCAGNIILIGDSRFCGMAYYVMGFDYTYIAPSWGTGSNIRSTTPITYNGYSIHVTAQVGASASTFMNSSKDVYTSMHRQLVQAAAGTKVFLWLGVNDLSSSSTLNLYKKLASAYTKLTFYAVSVTGVGSRATITNTQIKTLNSGIQSGTGSPSNLKWESILKDNDPTRIYNKSTKTVTFTVNDSTTDYYGLHYTTDGYRKIFDAMMADI